MQGTCIACECQFRALNQMMSVSFSVHALFVGNLVKDHKPSMLKPFHVPSGPNPKEKKAQVAIVGPVQIN